LIVEAAVVEVEVLLVRRREAARMGPVNRPEGSGNFLGS
jgi:hypothetical protein